MQFTSSLESSSHYNDDVTLRTHPKQFRSQLEAALIRSVLITAPEAVAKGKAIDEIAQLLLRTTSGRNSKLQLLGQPVSIDRFVVAGSIGKSVAVQGQWDVDLVAFVNLPGTSDIVSRIDLLNPEVTQRSWWLADLQQQLCRLLQQQLGSSSSSSNLRLGSEPPHVGRAAVQFSVIVQTGDSEHELEFDVLLAPNFAAGAGAAAAAAARARLQYSSSVTGAETPADVQRRAVLAPVLVVANAVVRKGAVHSPNLTEAEHKAIEDLQPSFLRNVWLSEAAAQFVMHAADEIGVSGRVVTSTICLVKAWVHNGLQQQPGMGGYKRLKSFQIELLVLHAAERLAADLRGGNATANAESSSYASRFVLDLLLKVLDVSQEWAAAATAAGFANAGVQQPVLFTGLAATWYYSKKQALALQELGFRSSSSNSSSSSSGQPLVTHPVDPTCSVFDQAVAPFELWREFGEAARLLQQQLLRCSWGEIRRGPSLGAVLG
jgi:hypothetical protein